MNDVIDLSEKRKAKKTREKGDAKFSFGELCDAFAEAMNHGKHSPLAEVFPERFFTYEVSYGTRLIVQLDADDIASIVADTVVINALTRYAREDVKDLPEALLTARQAKEVLEFWRAVTAPIKEIPYVRFKSEPGPTFNRLPFDRGDAFDETLTPTWNEIFGRIASPDAASSLYAWIGSLFHQSSYRQQYVWIYGGGGNGKGAIARFLHRVFGKAGAHFINHVPSEPNQFWTGQLVNKRLIVLPDCENYHFPTKGLFKSLSGDDPITVEPKQKAPYTALLECKFLFTSNQLPALSSERADLRRPIFVRLESGGEWSASFEDRLWDEAAAFLTNCLLVYDEACPTHGPIAVDHDASELNNWVSTLEEPFEEFFEEWFTLDKCGRVTPADMQKVLKSVYTRRGQQLEFMKWLDRTYQIRKKTVRLPDGGFAKSYAGIIIKKNVYPHPLNE